MTYQTFKENIRTVIQNKLGENVTVRIQDIIKNNNMHLDGLSVFSNEINVSPTIYLNPYFKKCLSAVSNIFSLVFSAFTDI